MPTCTAAVELAPHGISVVDVGPSAVATPIHQGTLDDPAKKTALNERKLLHLGSALSIVAPWLMQSSHGATMESALHLLLGRYGRD
jgi:NAD(P)-dependent dehydrogenase (short-subunit alcohol dehydrogenase family)